jgi:arsenate reductase (thioredoxin)
MTAKTKPAVLFLCTHNAGRSQMALGYFNYLARDQGVARSGGSEPGNEINPAAVAAMAEVGIDITGEFPKPWTDEIVQAADVVVTMGCGDACPFYPGKRYENWELPDRPAKAATPSARSVTTSKTGCANSWANSASTPSPNACNRRHAVSAVGPTARAAEGDTPEVRRAL